MFLTACLVISLLATVRAAEVEEDEGVLVLNKDNFQQVIDSNEFVLVEFYAPWCGHCKALAPEYVKAAKELADSGSGIKLAKVDATEENELAQEFGVRGYPTMKFFKNGTPKDYAGGRKAPDIVAWVTRQSGPPTTTLETVEAAKEFSEKADVVVIGYFDDLESVEAKAYTTAADTIEEPIPFGITNVKAVVEGMEADANSVVMYKKFDDGKVTYTGEMETGEIIDFILLEQLPLVPKFSDATAPKIFGGNVRSHLLAFFPTENEKYSEYMQTLATAAKSFKGKVLFVHVDSSEDESGRIMDFFNIEEDMVPVIRLINLGDDMKRFVPDFTEIDAEMITGFVQSYLDGELTPHLNSEEIPEDWDQAPVKVLVGKNFNEIALDASKHVFVEFYAPWCGHCKQLAPIWEELAEHFKDDNEVVIAKMDSTKNEVENISVRGFPTLKFFPKDSEEILDYQGGRTLDELIEYVEKQVQGITDDEVTDEGDDAGTKDEL